MASQSRPLLEALGCCQASHSPAMRPMLWTLPAGETRIEPGQVALQLTLLTAQSRQPGTLAFNYRATWTFRRRPSPAKKWHPGR